MAKRSIRITHAASDTVLAEGPIGWGITPFEGNYYIRKQYLRTDGFELGFIPGLCFYKFLYLWMDLVLASGERLRGVGWMYVVPNPLLPFIWFRVALPGGHPALRYETVAAIEDTPRAEIERAPAQP
ncbi:MAG: hypothetical protein AAF721_02170 [Myxococcota bacterium]